MSNPPRPATRPATGFEDQEALRDLTTPASKHTRSWEAWQVRHKRRLSLREFDLIQIVTKEIEEKWKQREHQRGETKDGRQSQRTG